jgi:YD repeat-containing protein
MDIFADDADQATSTEVTDQHGNIQRYYYNTAGRLTKAAGGSGGTLFPTTFGISATTGLMTKVTYNNGSTNKSVDYEYDNMTRITKMKDWMNATNGIQYAFDNGNRLTKITDYDGVEAVTYAYDGSNRVTSMTDTHGGVTAPGCAGVRRLAHRSSQRKLPTCLASSNTTNSIKGRFCINSTKTINTINAN